MVAPRQSPCASNAPRRKSSVYDPARDIFAEIPEPVRDETANTEQALKEAVNQSNLTQVSPPHVNGSDGISQFPEASNPDFLSGSNSETIPRKTTTSPAAKNRSVPPLDELQNMCNESKPRPSDLGIPGASAVKSNDGQTGASNNSPKSPAKPKTVSEVPGANAVKSNNGQTGISNDSPKSPAKPKTISELPRIKRKEREEGEIPEPKRVKSSLSAYSRRPHIDRQQSPPSRHRPRSRSPRRRSSPRSVYHRHDSPPSRERSPSPIRRSPPPSSVPHIRPGGATGRGRNVLAEQQRIAAEREREQAILSAQIQASRGVQDVSNQFYNARPEWVKEKGREWRKNESKIKGLRSFNNWIKSCIIQKFSPEGVQSQEELGWGEKPKEPEERKPLLVLDIGCGKGGDLGKWQLAPQTVGLYVGLDPADQSIAQAVDRYRGMRKGRRPIFDGRFHVKDCFSEWIGDVPIVREVGIDPNSGMGGNSRWGGGGFDVVSMMFSMHYAFESEQRVRMMLRNVAGALKKGGRFLGVVPNSDALATRVREWHSEHGEKKASANGEKEHKGSTKVSSAPEWGNSIYRVRFPTETDRPTVPDGTFRPPFGWKYIYWMDEAVDVPEYVVPWEAFRAIAEGFNLEQRFRKPFLDVWAMEKDDKDLSPLSVRMGVRRHDGGPLEITEEEKEAASFYHAFCFVKV